MIGWVNTTGWQCPYCHTVYAPWISRCDCRNDTHTTTTSSEKIKDDTFNWHDYNWNDYIKGMDSCLNSNSTID